MSQLPTDREIAFALLDELAGYSQEEMETMVDGVTQSDVSRWKRGVFRSLSGKKRRSVLAFLEERGIAPEEIPERARSFQRGQRRDGAGVIPATALLRAEAATERSPYARADQMIYVLTHAAMRSKLRSTDDVVEMARALSRDFDDANRAYVEAWIETFRKQEADAHAATRPSGR